MKRVSEDAATEVASAEQLTRMLGDLCRRVEQGYNPVMITRIEGLGEWWAAEKARRKAVDELTPKKPQMLRSHYTRLAADFVNTDPERF